MKTLLEVGDKIQRFDTAMTKEISSVYTITEVTKTLAKTQTKTFRREIDYSPIKPKKHTNKIIGKVYTKERINWTSPDYFLIELSGENK